MKKFLVSFLAVMLMTHCASYASARIEALLRFVGTIRPVNGLRMDVVIWSDIDSGKRILLHLYHARGGFSQDYLSISPSASNRVVALLKKARTDDHSIMSKELLVGEVSEYYESIKIYSCKSPAGRWVQVRIKPTNITQGWYQFDLSIDQAVMAEKIFAQAISTFESLPDVTIMDGT